MHIASSRAITKKLLKIIVEKTLRNYKLSYEIFYQCKRAPKQKNKETKSSKI